MTVTTVDSREPLWLKAGLARVVPDLREAALPCGDFELHDSYGPLVLVERKNVNDFLNSLADGRLESQVARCMAVNAARTFLMVEGAWTVARQKEGGVHYIQIGDRLTGWAYNSVVGQLITLQERNPRLLLLWPANHTATLATLEYLARTGGPS